MTSSDVRDVLNLGDGPVGPRPPKKAKTSGPRPNLKGLAREVQNLGGDNPIAIVPEVSVFKKRRFANRKPATRWELRSFRNSAHPDGNFLLKHWRRKTEVEAAATPTLGQEPTADSEGQSAEPQIEDSAFAKYNVQVVVPQYDDDRYQANLTSTEWTKEETDYLLEIVRDYDLRWPLIWDRYDFTPKAVNGEIAADGDEAKAVIPAPKVRTMEDLKARYYEVAAKMMAVQKPVQYMTQPEFALHEMMANFNAAQETLRKEFAAHFLSRSPEEAKEEESLLLELKRILARQERFNEERRDLYNRLDYPHTDADISAFKSSTGLHNLLQNLMNADKTKKRRSLMEAQGISSSPANGQTSATAEPANRRESIAVSVSGSHRDSIGAAQTPTTATSKKSAQHQERRKLTEAEEYIYGISHHDRLSSGPTFRYEKINKMFTHKSNQQQMRITNTLNELDVPPRLIMPTAAITAQYEQLLAAVTTLLDARKVMDKLEAEMKIELAKKAELDGPDAVPASAPAPPATTEVAAIVTEEEPAASEAADKETANVNATEAAPTVKQGTQDGEEATADTATAAPEVVAEPDEAATASVEPKEDGTDGDKNKPGQPGASGTSHKRSASVLSTVSDKSAKRQKK